MRRELFSEKSLKTPVFTKKQPIQTIQIDVSPID
jgi:hypothetical protein